MSIYLKLNINIKEQSLASKCTSDQANINLVVRTTMAQQANEQSQRSRFQ